MDLPKLAETNVFFKELHEIVSTNAYIWNLVAEEYVLKNGKSI